MTLHQHGGRVYDYARALGVPLHDIMDFSANINPLGPPDSVMKAVLRALDEIRHYPDASARAVKTVLVRKYGVAPAQLLCGNGASEVLDLLFRAILPRRTFVLEPAFSEYRAAAHRSASVVKSVPLPLESGGSLPLAEIDRQVRAGDMVVINNPHNPTGKVWPRTQWHPWVVDWNRRGVFVLFDESFIDFLPEPLPYTALPEAARLDHLLVVRSATKMYAIPGLRFGFAVGAAPLFAKIERERDGWSVNHLAQAAAAAAYQDTDFERKTWAWLAAAHQQVGTFWRGRPEVAFFPPSVNYFLVKFQDMQCSGRIQTGLRRLGMFVRPCSDFAHLDGRYIRIAIRSPEENHRLQEAVLTLLLGQDA
ncbi:aminotransferase class I/II-fold pyridoxal phosphate-dependent enzyme [Alicyclobacillus cycloheptanicus]|uniref:Threonine-phosphate decarboxylase n=1 Tax=Alicyclobacillus cycloheptanicus TaxID=1457 RepID=A0ABT9XFN0_9BACL|nr:aminotransferase class I/II-fold pyridoxal phosphate-dependent enzyme [Alicyclobacillus cycloheptanicus]MDQ0189099.1 threonine-phosphate decarboxylase [Alicyclobacillus cycloheptanicus]WDM00231.1 aminotransferase class I/II-fold pyridoxal phosphate-dependent enzyme [Alicyclobacillus cycloheptanicus]